LAESLYTVYSRAFGWSPEKINIVLVDAYDFPNGFATPIFENTVYLYLQPPVGDPYFGSMEGWIEILLKHELVHIFHMDKPHPVSGMPYPELVRYLFGRNPAMCAFPNMLDPGWQAEGIATYYESKGGFGRLNNRYFRDQMLAYVRDGGRLTPDLMSVSFDIWPYGRAYLWGGLYLEYVARRYGEREVVDRIVNSSYCMERSFCCGCFIGPLFLKDVRDFPKWSGKMRAEAVSMRDGAYRYLTNTGNSKGYVALSPSGRYVAYTERTFSAYPSLKVMDVGSGRVIREVRALAVGPVSWSGDTLVLFSQYRVFRNFYVFSDVYALNVITGEVKRLTKGERAHSPVSTPHGILYVRREGPRQSIVKLGGEVVLKGGEREGFTDLRFYNDTLYFTFYHHGWTDVAYVPYGDDSVRLITRTREPSLLSHVDSSGVYFTENFTPHVFEDGRFLRLLNNPLSVLYPHPYGDSLLLLSMRGKGLDVAVTPKVKEATSLPRDFRRERETVPVDLSHSRPYNPLPHLLPKFWHPLFLAFSDPLSGVESYQAGFLTAGSDILYRHAYTFGYVGGIAVDNRNGDTILSHGTALSYVYDGLRPTFGLNISAGGITDTKMDVLDYSVELEPSVVFPFNHIDGREYVSGVAFTSIGPDTVVWSAGLGAGISRLYSYKGTTGLLSDGFALNGRVMYSGGPGYELSGVLAFRKGLLFNFRFNLFALPYARSVSPYVFPSGTIYADTFVMASLEIYPDIFSPRFPDLNVNLIPPSPWAFYSVLALARIYPGVSVDYFHYSGFLLGFQNLPFRSDVPRVQALLCFDLVLFSDVPISLRVGYEIYPGRSWVVKSF